MSTPPLHYALRQTNGELGGNLGWLFTMYWLHCDSLLRCYPGNDLLKHETGIASNSTLIKHRDKLISMKALLIIPYDKRITIREKQLHQRKLIYQLTGIIQLSNSEIVPTVNYTKPEDFLTHLSILEDLEFNGGLIGKAFSETIDKWITDSKVTEIDLLKLQKLKLSIFSIGSTPLKEISTSEEDIAPDKSDDKKPDKPKSKNNPLYDAIAEVWGYEGGRNMNMQKFLTGKYKHKKDGDYLTYQIDSECPVTPDELLQWSSDIQSHKDHAIYEKLEKIQSSIYEWRKWRKNKESAQPVKYFQADETIETSEADRQAALKALKGDNQ